MQTNNRREIIWFDTNTFYPLPDNRFRHRDTGEDWTGVAYQNPGEACALKLAQDLYAYYGVNAPEQSLFKHERRFFLLSPPLPEGARPLGSSPFPTQPTLGRIAAVAEFLQEEELLQTLFFTPETLLKISSRSTLLSRQPRAVPSLFDRLSSHKQKIDFLETLQRIVTANNAQLQGLLLRDGDESFLAYLNSSREALFQRFQARRDELKQRYATELSSPRTSSSQLSQEAQEIDALRQQLFYYIPPRVNPVGAAPDEPVSSDEPVSWEEALSRFLQNPAKKVLLLQGDSGAGKSLSLLKLKFDPPRGYPTLHLELKRYHQTTVGTDIGQALTNAPSKLLLLDGYDEIAGGNAGNLYERSQLGRDPSLKVIISCRTQFLSSNYQSQFAPGSLEGLDEYSLAPFGDREIQAYLEKYTRENPQVPLRQYQETFEKISGLKALVQTPLLLRIACEAFPRLQALREINRNQLYEAFLRQWFANQAERLRQSPQLQLLNAPAETFFDFSKKLALRMADQNTVEVAYNPQNPMDKRWADFFGEHTPQVRLAREGCPLKRTGERYSFVHKSFLDYFTARGIWDALSVPENQSWRVYQLGLNPSFILRDPAVLTFLQEMQPDNLEPLVAWITRTREDRSDSAAHASACAATVLNGLQRGFGRYDLQGTRLHNADLRGAFLTGTNLQGADLSHTRLANAHFSSANLQAARFYRASLGQLPRIDFAESIQAIAWHPTQPGIIAVSQGNTIVLWNLKTQRPQGQPLTGHTRGATCLAFSPDGQTLASGSWDSTLRLWDLRSGYAQPRGKPLTGHTNKVICLAFSPDGRTLTSGSWDDTLRLWDTATGQPRGRFLTGHTSDVRCLAFSPNGRTLASGSRDRIIFLCYLNTGQIFESFTRYTNEVRCLSYSPDGRTLASGSHDDTLRLWDTATGQPRGQPLTGHTSWVYCLAFSPDGQTLASGSYDHTLRLWDIATGQPRGQPLTGHTDRVTCLAFSPDGQTLASGSDDKTLRLRDTATGQPRSQPLMGDTNKVSCLAFSPGGRTLASGSHDYTLRLWDTATGQPRGQPLTGHTRYVNCLAFSPDGRTLASGSWDHTLRLWDTATGQPRGQPLTGHTSDVSCLAFSPDGRTLASGSRDHTLRLWDAATGQPRGQPLTGHTDVIWCLAFSPDGQTLASGSEDHTLRLWEPATGQPRGQPLTGHTSWVYCLAFSPDGQTLASGSYDHTLRLWDTATGQPRGQPLTGHTSDVRCLAFSPDGQTLASGSDDKTLRLWEPATGQPRGQPLTGHKREVRCLAFSPDGQTLASGSTYLESSGHTLHLWEVKSQKNHETLPFPSDVNTLAFNPISAVLAVGLKNGGLVWLYPQQTEAGTCYFPDSSNLANTVLSFQRAKIDRVRDLTPRRHQVIKELEATGEPAELLPSELPESPILIRLREAASLYEGQSEAAQKMEIERIVQQLIGRSNLLALKREKGRAYLAQLQSMQLGAAERSVELDRQTFLSLRILSYVELWLKLNAEAYPELPPGVMKRPALEVLEAEIDRACALFKQNEERAFQTYRQEKLETRMEKPVADYLAAEEARLFLGDSSESLESGVRNLALNAPTLDLPLEHSAQPLKLSPLHLAVQAQDVRKVGELLQTTRLINQQANEAGDTPLHLAVRTNNLELVKLLVEKGADINRVNYRYNSPVFEAEGKILDFLLEHRKPFSFERLKDILSYFSRDFQKDSPAEKKQAVLRHMVGLLCGLQDIYRTKKNQQRAYFAHLQSLRGIGRETLEGMDPEKFLPLKILSYLELWFGYPAIREKLLQEIYLALETFWWVSATERVLDRMTDPATLHRDRLQCLLKHFIHRLTSLQENEEFTYQTGRVGHCIYVNFSRKQNRLLVRVDNLWIHDVLNRHVTEGMSEIKQPKVYPYLVQDLPFEPRAIAGLKPYLANLFQAPLEQSSTALPKIYPPSGDNQPKKVKALGYPLLEVQRVENCVAHSYSVGMQYRLGKQLYDYLNAEESRLFLQSQEIIPPREAPQPPTRLLLRGGAPWDYGTLFQGDPARLEAMKKARLNFYFQKEAQVNSSHYFYLDMEPDIRRLVNEQHFDNNGKNLLPWLRELFKRFPQAIQSVRVVDSAGKPFDIGGIRVNLPADTRDPVLDHLFDWIRRAFDHMVVVRKIEPQKK